MNHETFSQSLANLRKSKNISQFEMAKDLQISRATLSAFENGRNEEIGLKKIFQILDYLGCELCYKEKSRFPTFEELRDEQ